MRIMQLKIAPQSMGAVVEKRNWNKEQFRNESIRENFQMRIMQLKIAPQSMGAEVKKRNWNRRRR